MRFFLLRDTLFILAFASAGRFGVFHALSFPGAENLSFFLGSFEVVDGVFFLPLLVAPSLEAPQRGPAHFGG